MQHGDSSKWLENRYFTPAQWSLLKWHWPLGHMSYWSITWFAHLCLVPFFKIQSEKYIPICSASCFGKQSCTSPNTYESGAGIAIEHDQPVIFILNNQIRSPLGGLIPLLKGRQTSRKYHVATIFVHHFSKLNYIHFSESTTSNEAFEAKHALK